MPHNNHSEAHSKWAFLMLWHNSIRIDEAQAEYQMAQILFMNKFQHIFK